MRSAFRMCLGLTVLLAFAGVGRGDWNLTDPAKWVQLPDIDQGMNVNATYHVLPGTPIPWPGTDPYPSAHPPFIKVLADDWLCTTIEPITDVHIWGSWLQDQVNPGTIFKLSIHKDVPAGVDAPYSHPGEQLWKWYFHPGSYTYRPWHSDTINPEPFYDPNTNQVLGFDTVIWQYNFRIDPLVAFVQQGTAAAPQIYWLDVQAIVPQDPQAPLTAFGWKSALPPHRLDDAVYGDTPYPSGPVVGPIPGIGWKDLVYPDPPYGPTHPYYRKSVDLAFVITTPEPGVFALLAVGGLIGLLWAWRRRR